MSHDHNASSHKKTPIRKVTLVLILTASYMVAETVGGYLSNSLSLLADAGHMFADVSALLISLFASLIAARPPSKRASFGYGRAEVIAALFNGIILIVVCIYIAREAILRFFHPEDIHLPTMMTVAVGGLLINFMGLLILHRDKAHNLNIKSAWLHVLSDTLGSVGVICSGILMYFFGWHFADPLASLLIAGLVFYSSLHLVFDTVRVLMEHAPSHIDPHEVMEEILSLPDAIRVHDLHIWSITAGQEALSVHVVAKDETNHDEFLETVQTLLHEKFAIEHATIQLEKNGAHKHKECG
jgi:cobalt-zinc-cadmium efflux system protein